MESLLGWALAAACTAAALGCLLRAHREHAGSRGPWALLASASALGAGSMSAMALGGRPTGLGPVLAQVVAVACAAVALMRLSQPLPDEVDRLPAGRLGSRGRLALEAAAAALALTLVVWQVVLPAVVGQGSGSQAGPTVVAMADVVLGCAAVIALSRARLPTVAAFRSLGALALGLAWCAAGSALLEVARATGSLPWAGLGAACFAGGQGVVLLAALRPVGEADTTREVLRRERAAVLAPLVPMALAGVLWVAAGLGDAPVSPTATGLGVAMVLLLLAGAVLVRLDNMLIARMLEQRVSERTLELGTREKWFRSLVQNSSDIVGVVDGHGAIRYITPSIERILGHSPEAVIGRRFASLLKPSDARVLARAMTAAAQGPDSAQVVEMPVWAADGRWRDFEVQITSRLADPDIRGVILTVRDVSERRRMEEQLTRQAYTDGLTGLANRACFTSAVERALVGAPVGTVAVLFCDLDGFKAVNDSQGHAVGDELLGLVAQRLRGCVRPDDLIARLGGDEFAILVTGYEAERGALWVAQRVQRVLANEFRLGGRATSVGASTGIAINDQGGETANQLLRNADLAMYRAKALARSSFVRFEAQMHDALVHRVEAEKDLRGAAAAGHLRLHYQPLVDLRTGAVTGVEALLRWQHPTRGLLSPEEFIGLAEETGLIHDIGAWALGEATQQAVRWQCHAPAGGHFRMAVNVSARQLDSGLPRLVRDAVTGAGLAPAALTLEMTESVLLERTDEVLDLVRKLKRVGVRLALDDFGTGYSSLSYLARLPVDVLKIDRAFVEALGAASEEAELARAIVQLGAGLRLTTVAEGIETPEQRDILAGMGCDLGQGYLFAPPLPADELDAVLAAGTLAVVR